MYDPRAIQALQQMQGAQGQGYLQRLQMLKNLLQQRNMQMQQQQQAVPQMPAQRQAQPMLPPAPQGAPALQPNLSSPRGAATTIPRELGAALMGGPGRF